MATVNELLRDAAVSHAVDLQQFSNGVVQRIIATLNRSDTDLVARLQAALDGLTASAATVERLESLLASVRLLNLQAYQQIERELTAELRALTSYEAGHQAALFEATIPPQVITRVGVAAVNVEQVFAAAMARPFQGRLLREWAADIGEERMVRVRDAARMGFVQQESISQIVQRVRGTRARAYKDGLLEIDRRSAEAVVRTAIGHTAGFTRDRFHEANADLVKAESWTSTLDSRTSEGCRIRDGKQYTPGEHKPIGHKIPWLGGPGRLHWNAVPAGTLIRTADGDMPIERLRPGVLVWTHKGRLRPVLDLHSKLCESGVVRTAHTQSGRVLSATYDHPVLTAAGWQFMGALKVCDRLLSDQHGLDEVGGASGSIHPEAEYDPALSDDSLIALARAFELVPTDIDFERNLDVRAREIEDCSVAFVLRNPERVKSDQCAQHHLFAVAHALKQLGRHRLSDLLANCGRDRRTAESLAGADVVPAHDVRLLDSICNAWHVHWIAIQHALGMARVSIRALFGLAPSPVRITGGSNDLAGADAKANLIPLRADGEAMALRVGPQGAVGKSVFSFNVAEGEAADQVLIGDETGKARIGLRHDVIVALQVQTYNGCVYDLSVDEDASYIADGFAVSNCRSTAVPVIKSWAELGLDIGEVPATTRASMDGQVPEETTFGAWIKRQSAARQDQVLGPTRAKLMRSGGLDLDRFYNDKGRALSLDEMRQRDAAAFKRAGL